MAAASISSTTARSLLSQPRLGPTDAAGGLSSLRQHIWTFRPGRTRWPMQQPQQQQRRPGSGSIRQASSTAARSGAAGSGPDGKATAGSKKPIVLEKPAKFNPPSHGARLPRKTATGPASRHYGGDLSATEAQAQKTKEYPGTMAPEGTWWHYFWNSRRIHMTITVVSTKPTGLLCPVISTCIPRSSSRP